MKDIKRVLAFILAMVFCTASFAFAADTTPSGITISSTITDKLKTLTVTSPVALQPVTASIVSPSKNTISTSDSLLVSVKLTQPGTVNVTVFEEMIENVEVITTRSAVVMTRAALEDSTTTEQAVIYYTAYNYTTFAAYTYESVDTSTFEAIDFTSNSALETYVDRVFEGPVSYTSKEQIGFYTKQISVKPGIYKIAVDILDEEGKVTETVSSLVVVKEKPVEEETPVFEQKQSGALKLLQNLLKSLFK